MRTKTTMSVVIDPQLKIYIDKLAADLGVSRSAALSIIIRSGLEALRWEEQQKERSAK